MYVFEVLDNFVDGSFEFDEHNKDSITEKEVQKHPDKNAMTNDASFLDL